MSDSIRPRYAGQRQPPRGTSPWLWVLLGVGGGLGLCCLLCCGGALVFAMTMAESEAIAAYDGHPTITDVVGQPSTIAIQKLASLDAAEDIYLFDVDGPQGHAVLEANAAPFDDPRFYDGATLILDDGSRIPLTDDDGYWIDRDGDPLE